MRYTKTITVSNDWVNVISNPSYLLLKALNGNWKSWRVFISNDGSEPNDLNDGELYSGNTSYETNAFAGTLFVRCCGDEPIDFSVTYEESSFNELTIDGENQFTEFITPNSSGYLNVSILDNSDGNTIQIKRLFPEDDESVVRYLTDNEGTLLSYVGNLETSIVDKQPGVRYSIGCITGGYVAGNPICKLSK